MYQISRGFVLFRSTVVLLACLAFPACDTIRNGVRHGAKDEPAAEKKKDMEGNEVLGVDAQAPQKFFRSSRLSGGLSDESREIERDLGIK
jgi:hypothetical protein